MLHRYRYTSSYYHICLEVRDENVELTTDHFKFACPELSVNVSFLVTGLLTHGTLPTDMVSSNVCYTYS